jgi:hypothetical protein
MVGATVVRELVNVLMDINVTKTIQDTVVIIETTGVKCAQKQASFIGMDIATCGSQEMVLRALLDQPGGMEECCALFLHNSVGA